MKQKKTADDYYLESENFFAWNNGRYYEIKQKLTHYFMETTLTKEETKKQLLFYEERLAKVREEGEVHSIHFFATPDRTKCRHLIYIKDKTFAKPYVVGSPRYNEKVSEVLEEFETMHKKGTLVVNCFTYDL